MSIRDKTVASIYKDLVYLDSANNGVTTSLRKINTGSGLSTNLQLALNKARLKPQITDDTEVFVVQNKGGDTKFQVSTTGDGGVKVLGTYANTNIKEFFMSHEETIPDTSNEWTFLNQFGVGKYGNGTIFEGGTGSEPDTALSLSTNAMMIPKIIWWVPVNINIDAVYCTFGADSATSDAGCEFFVQKFTMNILNSTDSGNLSSGTKVAGSGGTISNLGYEQAYYQQLAITSATVNANQGLAVYFRTSGTPASDFTCHVQIQYHII